MSLIENKPFRSPLEKDILIWAAFIYLATFLWILFLTQGLPIGDVDDWVSLRIAKSLSWKELSVDLFRPWSKSAYWVNQVDLVDQVSYKRTIHGIVLKSLEAVFGLRFLPLFIFAKAVPFSGTVSLLSVYLYKITRSLRFAIAGTLFFVFVPAHYAHILWVSDPVTMVHFFVILGMGIFSLLSINLEQNRSAKEFFFLLGAFFIVGWCAMKTKEPGLILPLTTGAYAVLRLPHWKTQKSKAIPLILVAALLAFQIVPIEHLSDVKQALGFNWTNMSRMLLRNYECGYENEPTTAFFSLKHIWPASIARTFGFFSLWTLAIFVVLYGFRRFRGEKQKSVYFLDHPLVRMAALWAIIEILLMGLFQPEPRFLSGTMIPLTLLATRLVWCLSQMWVPLWRVLFVLISILSWAWTSFYMNFQHAVWLRMQIGQRTSRYMNTAKLIYKDQFPQKSPTWWDIGLFYCPAYVVPSLTRPRFEDLVFHTELPYESWNKTKTGSLEDFERYGRKGAIYYVTYSKDKFNGYAHAVLFSIVSGTNDASLFERLVFKLKKKRPAPLYIFKG